MKMPGNAETRFALCIRNDGYPGSLEPRKLYEMLRDPQAEASGQVRVVDESGEDYLYPSSYFMEVSLPAAVEAALRRAS